MPAPTPADDIAKRYGLESVPESVRRLGRLVNQPDASTEEIAKLISADKDFTARLLRAANPRAESEADYSCTTVEEALQRTGMGAALLVAMHYPLASAIQKTFQVMLGEDLKVLDMALPFDGEHVLCEIGFTGKATGTTALRLLPGNALRIASRVLNMPEAELGDVAIIDDVIGELSNMFVGNFKSNLCDASLNCKLNPPAITRTSDFVLRDVEGSLAERICLRASDLDLFVDLNVNPWGE
jgi:CheY-specific phosphatase CheX